MSLSESLKNQLESWLLPILEERSLELYDLELVQEVGRNLLRVYIDSENGVNLDQCQGVSRELSVILDVEDPITDEYLLEVSSPGIFRKLRNEKEYKRFLGNRVSIRPLDGSRKIVGMLKEYRDETFTVEKDGVDMEFPASEVLSVNLNPKF